MRGRRDVLVVQGILELVLDVVLAALDLVDHRGLVVEALAQVGEHAVRGGQHAAVVLGRAAELFHLLLQPRRYQAAFAGAFVEGDAETGTSGLAGGLGITVGAVDGGFDKVVEHTDVVVEHEATLLTGKGGTRLMVGIGGDGPVKRPSRSGHDGRCMLGPCLPHPSSASATPRTPWMRSSPCSRRTRSSAWSTCDACPAPVAFHSTTARRWPPRWRRWASITSIWPRSAAGAGAACRRVPRRTASGRTRASAATPTTPWARTSTPG